MNGDIAHGFGRRVTVDRRIDDRVVEIEHALLGLAVPGLGVIGVLAVKGMVGAQGFGKTRLVVGRTTHPAVAHACPLGDGGAVRDEVFARARDPENALRGPTVAGVRRTGEDVFGSRIVEPVIHPRHHARGVAEGRVGGDVVDALAID
jgi:hypothetical protein